MKLLIVTEAWEPQVNGVVNTYRNLRRELVAMGHDVHILSPADFTIQFPCPGYPEVGLAVPLPFEVRQKIRRIRPDRIHIATEGPLGAVAAGYCRSEGLSHTTAYHTRFADYIEGKAPFGGRTMKDVAQLWIRDFHNRSAGVMSVSPKVDAELRGLGVTAPLVRMGRGIDTNIFHPGPSDFMKDAGPVALYVGRVAQAKNIPAFLDLDIPYTKVVVGDGPERAELQRRYPHAVFTGVMEGERLADCYRRADVVVFPSKTDTFGNVVVEALACGRPVAAFSGEGGHTVILRESFMGAVENDLNAAFARAAHSGGTPEQRFEHVRKNYSWRAVAEQFIEARSVEGERVTNLSLRQGPPQLGRLTRHLP